MDAHRQKDRPDPDNAPLSGDPPAQERERRDMVLSAELDANDVLRSERLAAVDKENVALERLVQRLCATDGSRRPVTTAV